MKSHFIKERSQCIELLRNNFVATVLTEEKLNQLPLSLQKHFRLCGFLNKDIAMNADIIWSESYLKTNPNSDWKKLQTLQFIAVSPIMRVAYMRLKAVPFAGIDVYKNGKGTMTGKVLGLFTVLKASGKEVSQSALITVFCEMMLLSGYAFQPYIQWKEIDNYRLEATLSDCGMFVKGIFHFDDEGFFTFFETDDRYFNEGKNIFSKKKFKAIIDSYKKVGEVFYPESVRVLWCLENVDYDYFKGTIKEIKYNVLN